ncbi:hypothetical protein Ddye_005755 [Dipteronia dyeriana]|uniref:RNase H type-1 domain-containing protein n=1 Tax=Dipteronia dyeriana TaxID=168575 RepID=A0AAD9XH96_9ROSI|nr:hypothetical protein Ddye_005755 [Dipteronia dyeriana]
MVGFSGFDIGCGRGFWVRMDSGDLFDDELGLGELEVVLWIKDGSHNDSVCGVILDEIEVLADNLGNIPIKHIPKKANLVAHDLAKYAPKVFEDNFWLEEFPRVRRFMVADMPIKLV